MKNVIINADDFGLKSSVNEAIIESFTKGLINSTTLMANMQGFEEAINLAHEKKITKKIGVHLVLTEGVSLTEGIKSMKFLFNKKEFTPELRNKNLFLLNKSEQNLIFKEYSAQIEKIRNNGIPITHLDTHHQIHDMWAIFNLLAALLKVYNIPSMRILNNLEKSKQMHKNLYRSLINLFLKAKKINYTNYLGNRIDVLSKLKTEPAFLYNNSVEIMVHPDYNKDGLLIDRVGNMEFDLKFAMDVTSMLAL